MLQKFVVKRTVSQYDMACQYYGRTKVGRPKKSVTKAHWLQVRIDADTKLKLMDLARRREQSMSVIVRDLVREAK